MNQHDIEQHRWFSNPLDWTPIHRMILLASLVLIMPLAFGGELLWIMLFSPDWLHLPVAQALLVLYALHASLLIGLILVALRRRREHNAWPLLENFVIGSFVFMTFVEGWLSGTHFTSAMLLLLLGVFITSALADVRKIYLAWKVTGVTLIAMAMVQSSGITSYAPLFTRPPYNPDGSPVSGWFFAQFALVLILLGLTRVSLIAIERWVERENLFREMSTVDGLTRLTNRRSFIERSENEFARAKRIPMTGLACIMMDIDHFKRINDTHGHPAGDAVLVNTSAILLDNARQYDEVGRYGGEEFAILLPSTTLDAAVVVAERLREKIAASSVVVDGTTISVTASFGVSCYPGHGIEDMNTLLKAADTALYEAKHGGRNRVVAAGPA